MPWTSISLRRFSMPVESVCLVSACRYALCCTCLWLSLVERVCKERVIGRRMGGRTKGRERRRDYTVNCQGRGLVSGPSP